MADYSTVSDLTDKQGIWHSTRGQRTRYATSVLASTVSQFCFILPAIIAGAAIDVITKTDFNEALPQILTLLNSMTSKPTWMTYLVISAVLAVTATVVAASLQYVRDRLAAIASESIAKTIREQLFWRIQHTTDSYFDRTETGDFVQRCSSDVETIRVFMHADVDEMGRTILMACLMLPILLLFDQQLTLIALVTWPVLIIGALVFFQRIKTLFRRTDEAEAELTTVIQENLTGIRVVQAFARQNFEKDRFSTYNREFRDRYFRLNKVMTFYWSISDFVCTFQSGLVLIAGMYFVATGHMTIGDAFVFIILNSMLIWRIRQLGRLIFEAGKAVVSMRRVNEVLSTPVESIEAEPAIRETTGEVEFRHVSLEYSDGQKVLDNVSFTVRHGSTLGIVGLPGSGKSTLIRALLRLYPLSEGAIYLDNRNIEYLNRQWLRKQIGVVFQEPFLYARSIRENLLVGNNAADVAEQITATQKAALHQTILDFPNQYAEFVGERGVTLSGGQRQRLAIARALIKRPKLLVLDDAFSAIDSETEQEVLRSVLSNPSTETTIVIGHRLSTMMQCDGVVVLENGRVVQSGEPEALRETPGPFRRMLELQQLSSKRLVQDA